MPSKIYSSLHNSNGKEFNNAAMLSRITLLPLAHAHKHTRSQSHTMVFMLSKRHLLGSLYAIIAVEPTFEGIDQKNLGAFNAKTMQIAVGSHFQAYSH